MLVLWRERGSIFAIILGYDACLQHSSVNFDVVVTQHLLVAKDAGRKLRAFRKRGKQKFLTGQKFY